MVKKSDAEEHNDVDDIVLEDTEVSTQDHAQKVQSLKKELKEVKAQCAEYLSSWQRDKAEFVNARKRDAKAREAHTSLAKATVLEDMLPVLDSFAMAMSAETWEAADATWRSGVERIYTQVTQILEKHGLVAVVPECGDLFDPALHESVATEKTEKEKDGKIVSVVQNGYQLHDTLLRPARVIVGSAQ